MQAMCKSLRRGAATAALALATAMAAGAATAQQKLVMKASDVHPAGYPTVVAVENPVPANAGMPMNGFGTVASQKVGLPPSWILHFLRKSRVGMLYALFMFRLVLRLPTYEMSTVETRFT